MFLANAEFEMRNEEKISNSSKLKLTLFRVFSIRDFSLCFFNPQSAIRNRVNPKSEIQIPKSSALLRRSP